MSLAAYHMFSSAFLWLQLIACSSRNTLGDFTLLRSNCSDSSKSSATCETWRSSAFTRSSSSTKYDEPNVICRFHPQIHVSFPASFI
eukprot:6204072-Pleurochrysis_carterae.AAC.1